LTPLTGHGDVVRDLAEVLFDLGATVLFSHAEKVLLRLVPYDGRGVRVLR
jgi:hypothetical protein